MASGANPSANKCLFDDHLLQAIGIKKDTSASRDDCSYIDMFAGKQGQATYIKMFVPEEGLFEPMEKPKSGDWLKEHTERGQTFKQFITGSYRSPDSVHKTVYLLPMVFKEDPVPPEVIAPLERFAAIFFGMPASVMAPESFLGRASDRVNAGVYQVHAGELLGAMGKNLKRDAFCCAGITMADLYPRESWNFVFGLASSAGNTGVYSLARYLSNFGDHQYTRIDLTRDPLSVILVRACKTMCHEIGHMFGIRHCVHFKCLMNGSNHLAESDGRPNFLCPVCLRKLQHACRFDVVKRYRDMREFWSEQRVPTLTDWLDRRLSTLTC